MIPWNPCPPSRGIRAHLAVEFVPAIAWNSHTTMETLFSVGDQEALAKAISQEEGRSWEHMPEYSVGLLDSYSRQFVRMKAARLLEAVARARIERVQVWEQAARDVQQ